MTNSRINDGLVDLDFTTLPNAAALDVPPPPPDPAAVTEIASKALCDFAKEHVRPTIEALSALEHTVRACRETLQDELKLLEHQSQNFADRNREALHCLNICTQAVDQLVNNTHKP